MAHFQRILPHFGMHFSTSPVVSGIWYLGTRDPGDYGCFFFVFFSVRCILKAHETKRKWTNSVRMTLHGLREYHQAPNTHRVLVRYPPLTCNTTL